MTNVTITINCERVILVALIAFYELIASGLSSLAMQGNWYTPFKRGIFIVVLSGTTIMVRIIQLSCYKYKLSRIASKKQMIISQKNKLSRIASVQNKNAAQSHDNMSEKIQKEMDIKKEKEDKAADLINYNFALYFIAFSTFSDASFDIVQGIVLIFGYSTTTHPLAVIGSYVGFGTEVIDFFEEILSFACGICNEALTTTTGTILEKFWCISVSVGCVVEQIIAIYVVSVIFECINLNDFNMCSGNLSIIVIVSLISSLVAVIVGLTFLVMALKHNRVSVSLDLSAIENELNDNDAPALTKVISAPLNFDEELGFGKDLANPAVDFNTPVRIINEKKKKKKKK